MASFNGHEYEFLNQRNAYALAKEHGGLEVFQNPGKAPGFALHDGSVVGYISKKASEYLRANNGNSEALKNCDIVDMSRDGGKSVPTLLLRGKPANRLATFFVF